MSSGRKSASSSYSHTRQDASRSARVIRQPAGPEASGITLAEQALALPEKAAGGAGK